MKIAVVLPDLRGGGAERVNIDLARGFAVRGHEVEFVLMRAQGEFLAQAQANFGVTDLGVDRVRQVPRVLAKYLRQVRPDALLANMWPLTVVAPIVCRLHGYRGCVAVSEHNTLSRQYSDRSWLHSVALQASTSVGYRLADRRIGVSGGVVDDIARLSHMRRSVFEVINNPVPMRSPPPAATLAAVDKLWGVPHGKRIVTVGSLKAQKNHLLLLQAFAKIGASDARLMLVGDGSGKPVLIELAKELGVGDQVIFAGFQPDPTPFYVSADLFVLSSDHEGLPTVLIESLACGTPVVSTDCPSGPSEILDHGRYGRLVPVRDPDALSQAMTESLAVSHDKSALVERARYFSTDRAVQAYLSAFGIGNG